MKRFGTLIFLFFSIVTFVTPKQSIKVYEPLKGEKYNRIVLLKPELEIRSENGIYSIEDTIAAKCTSEGTIFLQKFNSLLKFSPEGNYQGNIVERLECPDKGLLSFRFLLFNSKIHIFCIHSNNYIQ